MNSIILTKEQIRALEEDRGEPFPPYHEIRMVFSGSSHWLYIWTKEEGTGSQGPVALPTGGGVDAGVLSVPKRVHSGGPE